ncbi:MAG: hypothetical protein A2Y38_24010 [Spirochaetes bacterium GWB1_59_5]|nr:MAG: hypothetical protein A2Y38_24010 [Spirochaetes bacterium GWB1_59_5]
MKSIFLDQYGALRGWVFGAALLTLAVLTCLGLARWDRDRKAEPAIVICAGRVESIEYTSASLGASDTTVVRFSGGQVFRYRGSIAFPFMKTDDVELCQGWQGTFFRVAPKEKDAQP